MARTEHLFDTTLGGRNEDGLRAGGGLSLQYVYLDDAELETILRAVSKQDRSEEIAAPRLLIYNNTRANMQVLRQTSFIRDYEVEIAQAAAVANPVVDVVKDGVVLDVRPVVSADRRFITMELRPTVMELELPIPEFVTTLGVGQPVSIQLPRTTLQRVRTTITMPDGATVLLGGTKLSAKQDLQATVPILGQIPLVNFFFGRKGTSIDNRKLLILIRAAIIIPMEHEPTFVPDPIEALMGSGSR
jgi:type II secretory pathway component GspD/PulD (secretin)